MMEKCCHLVFPEGRVSRKTGLHLNLNLTRRRILEASRTGHESVTGRANSFRMDPERRSRSVWIKRTPLVLRSTPNSVCEGV